MVNYRTVSINALRASVPFFLLLLTTGCGNDPGGDPDISFSIERINPSGGRVAWYKGTQANHELIAFDRIVGDATTLNTEVFVMEPDGSGEFCVTCNDTSIPKGFIGQPEWHPDGEHLIVQAENANSEHRKYNHLSWGIDQDLWIIRFDGSNPEKIYDNSGVARDNHGALHPHFNGDGTKLIFAERIATGVQIDPGLCFLYPTPGCENPWAGWRIHLADYDPSGIGTGRLSNHTILYGSDPPADRGFFETHGFFNGGIIFSATAGGQAYVDDVYSANLDGSNAVNLTNSPTTWEEHGTFSPSGNAFAYISSRVNPDWQAPQDNASTLRTEIYLAKNGTIVQLTSFNAHGEPDKRYLTSDFEWDRTGRRIVLQVAPVDDTTGRAFDPVTGEIYYPEIWVITFPEAQ